jgi:hypothetical protein
MNFRNKYSAKKTYSELCGRTFDSKAEARRGEELELLQKAGEISDLQYQIPFQLCLKPNIKMKVDFAYKENGRVVYEDVKGVTTREARIKLAWLKQSQGVDVKIVRVRA